MKITLLTVLLLLSCAASLHAEEEVTLSGVVDDIVSGTTLRLKNLTYVVTQEPQSSPVNPDNVLGLTSHTAQNDVRLDVFTTLGPVDLTFKPRLDLRWDWWDDSLGDDSEGDADLYVHEWMARLAVLDNLLVSYGRENLQWGPSFLVSPSNPFGGENGRNSPKTEVRAADYAKLVWAPDFRWTVSLIANVDDGRRLTPWNADRVYALAVESVEAGRNEAQGLIDSGYRSARSQAKAERDAALADIAWIPPSRYRDYLEGQIEDAYQDGLDQIREGRADATRQADAEAAAELQNFDDATRDLREFRNTYAAKIDCLLDEAYMSLILSQRDEGDFRAGYYAKWDTTDALVLYTEGQVSEESDFELLLGGSYTFDSGAMLSVEYFFNDSGNADDPVTDLMPPYYTPDPLDIFLRQNYVLVQIADPEVWTHFDLSARWIVNVDDSSHLLLGWAEYDLADFARLFSTATVYEGDGDSEFGSLMSYSVMAGVECTF